MKCNLMIHLQMTTTVVFHQWGGGINPSRLNATTKNITNNVGSQIISLKWLLSGGVFNNHEIIRWCLKVNLSISLFSCWNPRAQMLLSMYLYHVTKTGTASTHCIVGSIYNMLYSTGFEFPKLCSSRSVSFLSLGFYSFLICLRCKWNR